MKKIAIYFGMLAVAAFAFSSCEKEIKQNQVNDEVFTHVATVTLSKDIDTKTAVVEGETSASYVWTEGDDAYLNIYECFYTTQTSDEGETEVKNMVKGTISDIQYSSDYKTATVTVSFKGNPTGPYSYEAIYAKSVSDKHNPSIPSTQYPKVDSFDPSADVMISKATDDVTSVNERLTSFSFTMGRVVTVNKMTLTGLVAGEKVKKVEFALNKHMAGTYTINTGNYTYGGTKLTLDYTEVGQEVGADGKFPVYFVSAPVDAAGIVSVVVTTDQNVYTKAGNTNSTDPFYNKSITFAIGTMKRFNMAMENYGEPISDGVLYTQVESASDLFDGATYIITGSDVDAAMSLYTGGNNHPSVSIQKTTNAQNKSVISIDNTTAVETVVLKKVGNNWTIQNNVQDHTYFGQYLICDAGGNNRLKETNSESSELKEWSISISDGIATIINANSDASRTQLYCNVQTNNPTIFNCYAPGQTNVTYHKLALYVDLTTCVEPIPTLASPSNLEAIAVENDVIVSWDAVEGADSYTVTLGEDSQTGVTETSTTFENVPDGNYTITVIAVSNNHDIKLDSTPATTTVKVGNINDGSQEHPYTVEEVRAIMDEGTMDACYVTGKISSIVHAYDADHGTGVFYISDDGETTSAQFEAFSVKFLGNLAWVNGNTQVSIGDNVVINCAGGLKIYTKDDISTYENDSNAYLYSLNDSTSETVPTIIKTDISGISADGVNGATTTVSFANNNGWTTSVVPDGSIVTSASISGSTITFNVASNTGSARTGSITVLLAKAGRTNATSIIYVGQDSASGSEPVTLIIDGSKLSTTATSAETTQVYDGVSVVFSAGAKQQSSTGDNKFTDKAILIGKNGAYIHASVPGTITKFEIYANKGASAKVSIGVNFSSSTIVAYNASATNTYTATLSTLDKVYDCTSVLPSNANNFWYQVTNANNSQVEFRITYTPN